MNPRKLHYFNYIVRLIRENIWYVLVFTGLILAFVMVQIIFLGQYNSYTQIDDTLTNDVRMLKSNTDYQLLRKNILSEGYDLDKINPVLAQLLPETEDYFSIVASLERISLQSQFLITSYSIRVKNSSREFLSLQIKGEGDELRFLEFLKNYNFGGGRLITIDKINFSRKGTFSDTQIDLNFYSGNGKVKRKIDKHLTFTSQDKEFVKKIMSKVTIELKKSEITDTQYETKPIPF